MASQVIQQREEYLLGLVTDQQPSSLSWKQDLIWSDGQHLTHELAGIGSGK